MRRLVKSVSKETKNKKRSFYLHGTINKIEKPAEIKSGGLQGCDTIKR
jgi:hypothetical protein